ncbi:N-acetylmuramoyl-L-alanine amidase [Streptomyces sp. SR27]|uniref:N-acetylmuramoyl-L-alanine amidase n=1 Tax=Streptomyces sp. SR27 TaxID=3076630 RepID=UPI00295BC958|nr:N-acetylmuramoyl-L-alanine amidase [Streptomyces sp. SR27]MDV9190962.1 N-acetylmuramoyl-L-alanine amidase [Streptomyces sp. SR27]
MTQRHRRDRKKRRLLYGAAAAVVATATIGTIAVASPGLLGAAGDKASANDASLQSQFANAAREFDVPQSVLMAVSYQQTRWESHDGEPSTTGAYNVMGLTKVDPDDVAQKVTDEQIDHFNGSGRPEIEKKFDRALVRRILEKAVVDTDDPRLHTLDKGAELIDSSTETVQNDTAASIRAGAALLADYQKQAGAELSDDPGDWYPAVARYSQSPERKGADLFAKRVFASIKKGERALTLDGEQVALPADPSAEPVKPSNVPLAATFAATTATPTPECPTSLNCSFVPVRTDPGGARNYTPADRPNQGVDIRQIVIHDTEGPYQGSLDTLTDPKGAGSAHYLIRAQDGQVTQMLENKQLAWHAGNWTLNMHAIGVEHEGFAMKEGSWFTEPQYRSSAELVKFLASKYGVPIDREHIIGHDEVALQTDNRVASLHWDAGPYWDWNYYMSLLGAPQGDKGAGGLLRAGQVVRVVPPFTTANQPKLTTGTTTATPRPANFGYLYTSPSTSATTLKDPYFTSLWSEGSNYGNKVRAGGSYVVAESRTDWTAIWYAGQKAWFYNPGGQYTVPVSGATTVKVKAGLNSTNVFGRAFPDTAAYTAAGLAAPGDENAFLTKFTFAAGQSYVKAGPAVKGDDWFGSAQRNVVGSTLFVPIRFHHKITWVKQSDIEEAAGTAPVATNNRYNLLARDTSGVLWQYQGNGTGAFLSRYRVGGGWNAYDTITPLTALRADGTGDAVAREASGTLWYYQGSGNPASPFKARLRTGGGWQVYDRILGIRDLNGDSKPDLIAREKSGVLWYYQGTGNPAVPFATRLRVGGGWQTYNQLISTGDLNGDGRADMVARDTTGVLWYYQGTGKPATPFAPRVRVGGGWGAYNSMVGPSDLDADGKVDLVARESSGAMWFYKGTGKPTAPFAARVQVGPGWQIYNMIF